jgi:hypothetical protein
VLARQEFPAVIEPPLRDIPESPDPNIEGGSTVLHDGRHDLAAQDRLLRAAREVALADERVQTVLGDRRFVVIGVSRRVDDKERREPVSVLLAYRYDDGRSVEVTLVGEEAEDVRVSDVQEVDYQPPPADDELERAIALARGARGVPEQLANGWEAAAILASDVARGDLHYGRRRFVVGFGPADERLPRIRALVDIGTERVVRVDVGGADPDDEHEAAR